MASYSLAQQCLSEFLGMATAIFLGESIIANEVLPRTKGHDLGFGFVALGFAFAFFIAIICFGFISAHINPATCLALAILGEIEWEDFVALSLAEVAGAFVGAVLVYVHYQPFFKTAPEPPALNDTTDYVRRRDIYRAGALNFALTKEPLHEQEPGFKGYIAQVREYMRNSYNYEDTINRYQLADVLGQDLTELYQEHRKEDLEGGRSSGMRIRRRSVQVADLHKRIMKQQLYELSIPSFGRPSLPQPLNAEQLADGTAGDKHGGQSKSQGKTGDGNVGKNGVAIHLGDEDSDEAVRAREHVEAAFKSALEADRSAKLVIFATKPAIKSIINNFVQEFLGTFALIWAALLISFQASQLPPDFRPIYLLVFKPFFYGLMIFVEILGLGGPTGFAVNPARDFGPRLAHFVLPIPGKGVSEWGYAWVPIVAPLCGGAFAGLIHWCFKKIDNTGFQPAPLD